MKGFLMGCDVHIYAEVKTDGVWQKVGNSFTNRYYDPSRETKTYPDGYVLNSPKTDEPYEGRNYLLFALLANVRNRYTFYNLLTHEKVAPLFPYRGAPVDASLDYEWIRAQWEGDEHSASYATLAELQAVDWDNLYLTQQGFVDSQEYERIRDTDMSPDMWCEAVSGPFVQKVSVDAYEREYRNVITDPAENAEEMMSIYINMQWIDFVKNRIGDFVDETIPALSELGSPEDVRIVFFFDN